METRDRTQSVVIRTDRGLSIAGTRITLYGVMDYVMQGWSPGMIQSWFDLTDERIAAVMQYIDAHRAEVEAEYRQVLQIAQENRQYWDDRNRAQLDQSRATLPETVSQEVRDKLHERKVLLVQEK